jgi:hypothetical protein
MTLPELSDIEIENHFKNNPQFGGCFSKNLTRRIKDNKFYILNLDVPSGSGSHWTLLSLIGPEGIYFDSFGVEPSEPVLKMMKKFKKVNIRNLNDMQSLTSSSCGFWCIFVIEQLLKGIPFYEIVNNFSNNHKKNEAILTKYFKIHNL